MPKCWQHLLCVNILFGLCVSEQLLSLCLLSFESLNTAASKDHCLACIEEAFFTPLWGALVALFRYCCQKTTYNLNIIGEILLRQILYIVQNLWYL